MAIIGIDLGTSNSAAAVLRGGRPLNIPSAEGISLGGKAFPSYVAITADGQTLVGEAAYRASNPRDPRSDQPARGQSRQATRGYAGRFRRAMSCPTCGGTGAKPGTKPRVCESCGDSGRRVITRDQKQDKGNIHVQQISVCPTCHGRGSFIDQPCKECRGSGQVEK